MLNEEKNSFIFPLLFLIFLALATSKAMLNISMSAYLIVGLFFLTGRTFHIVDSNNKKFLLFPIFLFAIGLVCSIPHESQDILQFLSKGGFLLTCPFLLYSLSKNKARDVSFSFFISGLFIALLFSLYKLYSLSLNIGISQAIRVRIDSFWDVGRWGEILAYSLCIIIPQLFFFAERKNKKELVVFSSLSFVSFICLIASGSRAAFLSISISFLILLIKTRAKKTIALIIVSMALIIPATNSHLSTTILNRITSISDLKENASNLSRIAMWKENYEMLVYKSKNSISELFVGSGIDSFGNKFRDFESSNERVNNRTNFDRLDFSYSDNHNTYLDLANKLGIIYLFTYLYFLYLFMKYFISNIKYNKVWAYAGLGLVLNHLIIGMFYTSGLSYQTIVLFYLLYLCYSYVEYSKSEQVEHVRS